LKSFARKNWDDCGFAHLGTEPVTSYTSYQAAGLIKWQLENIRGDGKFLFPVKALSKVLGLNMCGFTQPNNYTRVKKQLWEKQWVVLPKSLSEV
jgi:hypothetical protein